MQDIAQAGENDETVEIVIAIGASTDHAQGQVDLGEGRLDEDIGHGLVSF